jgi:NAD(P)-dependent dehydrogenase (short-subunit alcohol dehydrogenase family)
MCECVCLPFPCCVSGFSQLIIPHTPTLFPSAPLPLRLETCKALALAGCRVILCSRNVDAAEAAIKTEVQQPGLGGYAVDAGNIEVRQLDLSSLKSVQAFCEQFKQTEDRLDFLILNAGVRG